MASKTDLYVCVLSHVLSGDDEHTERTVQEGALLTGDDRAYLANPQFFVPRDTPSADRPGLHDFVGGGVQSTHEPVPSGGRARGGLRLGDV